MNKFYSILWINLSRRINLRHVRWLILHVSFCSPPYIHDKRGEFSRKLPILGLTFYPTRVSASSPGSWLKSRRNDFIPFACTALYVALPKRRTFPLPFLFSFCSTAQHAEFPCAQCPIEFRFGLTLLFRCFSRSLILHSPIKRPHSTLVPSLLTTLNREHEQRQKVFENGDFHVPEEWIAI